MLANYHTHTYRCRHAVGEDREYVEAAIRNGMQVLGFSDHCPWVYPDDTVSGTRMTPGEMDGYVSSILRLRDEYRDDIRIYLGLECEYIPELMEAQDKLLSQYPLDYRILGEHFLEREPFGGYVGYVFEDENLLHRYVDLCIEGLESGRYRYLAHPDLLGFSGSREVYDAEYGRLIAYLKAHDIPVEINMFGVVDKRHYPDAHFMQLAGNAGCKAIIGVDAHTPDRLNDLDGQNRCREIAEQSGLELLSVLPDLA